MMDIFEFELLNAAREVAGISRSRMMHTWAEIAELERQLAELKVRREGQIDARARLGTYRPNAGDSAYRCPSCWIVEGRDVLLRHMSFEASNEDVLRCPACGRDFGVSSSPRLRQGSERRG
jgi:hypothetical protein